MIVVVIAVVGALSPVNLQPVSRTVRKEDGKGDGRGLTPPVTPGHAIHWSTLSVSYCIPYPDRQGIFVSRSKCTRKVEGPSMQFLI